MKEVIMQSLFNYSQRFSKAFLFMPLLLTGCMPCSNPEPKPSVPPLPPTTAYPVAKASWAPCDEAFLKEFTGDATLLDCAAVTVPLDYEDPTGKTIDIAMSRYRRTAEGASLGTLFLNPGGPGGSGREEIRDLSGKGIDKKIAALHEKFDVVGFDPRGVGASSGLQCLTGPEIDKMREPKAASLEGPDPDESSKKSVADACIEKHGENFLRHLTTQETAQDLDLLRSSVGDEKLTYLGSSYGTYLGATYARLFPDRVRALVLDGAFDPTGEDDFTLQERQKKGFEQAFDNWVAWCSTNAVCVFGPDDVKARWLKLRDALRDDLFPGVGERNVGTGELRAATSQSLYNRAAGWPALGAALRAAEQGDGKFLLQLADIQAERNADGTYDSGLFAFPAITCASNIFGNPPADPEEAARKLNKAAPIFADGANANMFSDCAFPKGPTPPPLSYSGTAPILVVGGKNDPATPYGWAEKMASALGPNATLLTYEGEGHTAWRETGCIDAAINTLLIDATHAAAQTCPAPAPATGLPAWLTSLPAPSGALDVDIEALNPFLGLVDGVHGKTFLSTETREEITPKMQTLLEAEGWTFDGKKFTKVMDGQPVILLGGVADLSELEKQPYGLPIAEKFRELGAKSIVIYAVKK
jgi:pimeloyl-ACP methyl ester carboxylesterase